MYTSYDMVHQAKNTTMPSESRHPVPTFTAMLFFERDPLVDPRIANGLLLEPDGSQTIHAESWDVLGINWLGMVYPLVN